MIYERINELIDYGEKTGLIKKTDEDYTINRLLQLFQLEGYNKPEKTVQETEDQNDDKHTLEKILGDLTDYAYEHGLMKENSITYRDLFDTRIMGVLVPRPSTVIDKFYQLYAESPRRATDYYYKFSQDTNYIRRDRVQRDLKWAVKTEYGDIDITINLSKPEKDPKAIEAAKYIRQNGYPRCLLCKENVGYAGDVSHPARQNHRIIPVIINQNQWGLQYSPYVYYNEHCIVFNYEHIPMQINKAAFRKLLDFVVQFPHYFVGSNADLPIVGGSILSHDHFQGGNYDFAMAKAPVERKFTVPGFEDVEAGIVKWPMSVIRLRSKSDSRLVELADIILEKWRGYSDEAAGIYAITDGVPHNTITPIARKRDGIFELDLVLRNNLTTREHPLGVFHPHSELHHIKKENIGLIEVMGLAILPARLKSEMELVKEYLLAGKDMRSNESIVKHADWVDEFLPKYQNITEENIDEILRNEIGNVFLTVLEHAGVYKRTPEGQNGFNRFINVLK